MLLIFCGKLVKMFRIWLRSCVVRCFLIDWDLVGVGFVRFKNINGLRVLIGMGLKREF